MRPRALERVFARALAELDLSALTSEALPPAPRRGLPARVIAIGKAAPAMAAGALERWGRAVERCIVVAPDGTDVEALRRSASRLRVADRITLLRAAHPLPDARSVVAARACLDAAASDGPRAVVVLVSGGASALACAPARGVTLRMKRAIARSMLKSGASVQDVNVVRKHLSLLKGGGLARAAAPGDVLTIVASDVIGGAASDVGSGPSLPDPSTIIAARRLLRRYAPSFAHVPLVRTLAPPSPTRTARSPATIVASPEELARVVARLLGETLDVRVRVLPPSQAQADTLAAEYVALARRSKRACAFVRAAEPSVVVRARSGSGGRSTHIAALVGRALADAPHPSGARVLFGAFASDGVDGASAAGGAVVDERFAATVARRLGPDALARALVRFDTGTLHRAMHTAVACRPTGHNLADVHVLVVQ